ncbi:hypothetical protein BDR03DRAFT_1018217 [Suillus americanus]|nr:hypothetical protein BDR03DRAFT_1018217 [Suillus americanus]
MLESGSSSYSSIFIIDVLGRSGFISSDSSADQVHLVMRVGKRPSTPVINTTEGGRITLNECARIRGLTNENYDGNTSLSPFQPAFPPLVSDNQAPFTPRRRNVSLPTQLEHYQTTPEVPRAGGTGSPIFILQPARFTPRDDDSTASSPTTSSLTATRLVPTPAYATSPLLISKRSTSPPVPMFGENRRAVPLFRGDYNNKEEPTEWFAQFELSLPMSWSDSQRIERFEMQLAPGNVAEEWFQEIATFKTLTFTRRHTHVLPSPADGR